MAEFEFDEVDQKLLQTKMAAWEKDEGPRIGDFVRFPSGELERLCSNHLTRMQTSPVWAGSYFLGGSGKVSFSGSLNPIIPADSLTPTNELEDGEFWFFHHDEVGPGRGVRFSIPCRVFETSAPYKGCLTRGI